jgi:hypothetical protein
MYTLSWIGISIEMSTSWVKYTDTFGRHCTKPETKIFVSWTNATLLRIYFRNLSVQRYFLQYKSKCLKKVNVKYVQNRLWHEIFHIVPGISHQPISAIQLRSWAWYGSLELIPGPIWKMSCNNLLLLIFIANTSANLIAIKEKVLGTTNQ